MRNRPRHSIPGLFALGLAVTLAACGAQSPKTEQPMSGTSMPPAQKQFKAHFALNQASLSAKDAEAVRAAAAELCANPTATIRLVGKTDTTGSESYNMHLSRRRAETVSKALIAAGVPAYRINWQALGESQLEVPTGNDVREPKNRVSTSSSASNRITPTARRQPVRAATFAGFGENFIARSGSTGFLPYAWGISLILAIGRPS